MFGVVPTCGAILCLSSAYPSDDRHVNIWWCWVDTNLVTVAGKHTSFTPPFLHHEISEGLYDVLKEYLNVTETLLWHINVHVMLCDISFLFDKGKLSLMFLHFLFFIWNKMVRLCHLLTKLMPAVYIKQTVWVALEFYKYQAFVFFYLPLIFVVSSGTLLLSLCFMRCPSSSWSSPIRRYDGEKPHSWDANSFSKK